jgi:hypothetical protein
VRLLAYLFFGYSEFESVKANSFSHVAFIQQLEQLGSSKLAYYYLNVIRLFCAIQLV